MVDKLFNSLKIAVVHDTLTQYGGAEKVLQKFLEMFPKADLFVSIDTGSKRLSSMRNRLKGSWTKPRFVDPYGFEAKFLINNYWESLNLRDYDVVISSSDELSSKAVLTAPNTLHVCYCYTPPRYLFPEYSSWDDSVIKFPLKRKLILSALREADYIASKRPDKFIAISKVVSGRIWKYYRRDSYIIYPPVHLPVKPPVNKPSGDYYLFVGFLDKRKGVELAVRSFNKLKERFVVVGEGAELSYLKSIADKNIEFTGFVTEEIKDKYLGNAKGFIYPAIDEDFGIAPVEAMGNGVPVLAYKSGALVETVTEGVSGSFFNEFSEDSFIKAFLKFKKTVFDYKNIYKESEKFSEDKFVSSIYGLIAQEYRKINR